MEIKSRKRESGIELLRILAIAGVVLLHYNDSAAFSCVKNGSINQYVLFLLESLCICSVDLFVLISGYFLSTTQKRNYLKLLELIIQVSLFNGIAYISKVLIGNSEFILNNFITSLIPNNYFIIFYSILYIISPYMNLIINKLSHKEWNMFMITILILFSVWPTLIDLSEEIIGKEWWGLSSISASGSNIGFNIVNFMLLYFVGAYFKFNWNLERLKSKWKNILYIALIVLLIFGWALINENMTLLELRSAWVYHNPLLIILASLLFVLFKNMTFYNDIINEISKASFTCFLIHGFVLSRINIPKYSTGPVWQMLIHIIVNIIICYLLLWIVYKIYTFFTSWIFKRLEKNEIFKAKEIVKI